MTNQEKNANKKLSARMIALIVAIAIAVCGLVTVVTIVAVRDADRGAFVYAERRDLDKYVKIDPNVCKTLNVTINIDGVTESTVDRAINAELIKHRTLVSGAGRPNTAITVGDDVYIRYRGYTLSETGDKVDLPNTCNFSSASAERVTVGAGGLVPGFEEALIGKVPSEYAELVRYTDAILPPEGTEVYLTVTGNGMASETVHFRVMESNRADVDARYGIGFYDKVVGTKIGESFGDTFEFGDGAAKYTAVKVAYAVNEIGDQVITAETYFPYDYQDESFRGKTVLFDIYFEAYSHYTIVYDVPAIDEDYLSKTLELDMDRLNTFAGATLADKYRAMVRADLEADYEDNYNSVLYDAVWDKLREIAVFKKLPDRAVTAVYDDYIAELENAYADYKDSYEIKEFARLYYGLDKDTDYKEHFRTQAEWVVKEKLVFYYLAYENGLIPTGEKLETAKEEMIQYYMGLYIKNYPDGYRRSDHETEEAYQASLRALRGIMMNYYGEDFFTEGATYDIIMKELCAQVNVTLGAGVRED